MSSRAHVNALSRGDMVYLDSDTGYRVLTELAHLKRGRCCGNVSLYGVNASSVDPN